MMRYGWYFMGGSVVSHIVSAVLALAIVALLTLTIVMLVRSIRAAKAGGTAGQQLTQPEPDPIKILDERLARGEIDEEEYTRKKELMKK